MSSSELWTPRRWLAALWGPARPSITLERGEGDGWRWCPKRRALTLPTSAGQGELRADLIPKLTQLIGTLQLSSEGLSGDTARAVRGNDLGLWFEVSPLTSSLLLSSLELGVGERWARAQWPGLSYELIQPSEWRAPQRTAGVIFELWEACDALLRCGRGDVVSYQGRLLPLSELPSTAQVGALSQRVAELERDARCRYERYAWVLEGLEGALEELGERLKGLQARAPLLSQLGARYSSCDLTLRPTLLFEPFAYLSALEEALQAHEGAEGAEGALTRRERWSDTWGEPWIEEELRAETLENLNEEGAEQSDEQGEGLLPPEELEEAIWAVVAPHLKRVTEQLSEEGTPARSLRRQGLYESGRRAELRALMGAESRPDRVGRVWQRSTLPKRDAQATLILVDLSSSMRGERLDALLEALSLVCLALSALKVPFALFGFQDELIPLLSFEQEKPRALKGLITTLIAVYEEVWGRRAGGRNRPQYNDDGPCLARAAALLRSRGARRRALWVLSDGLPRGSSSGVEELSAQVERLTQEGDVALFALGLGPDTRHVEALYPVAQGDVPLERLAEVMGGLIVEAQRALR